MRIREKEKPILPGSFHFIFTPARKRGKKAVSMKTILPWILVVALGAGVAALYFSNSTKDAELAKAREQAQQVETLRTQLDEVQKQVASQTEQVASLKKDNEELLRLRNQVRQIADEKAQLTKQMQAAQSAQNGAQQQLQNLQSANQQLRRSFQQEQQVAQRNVCINNLRLLDSAKQTWALQNNKQANAVPNLQDITGYLPNHQMVICPAEGQYSLNAVNTAPTCSIPGHALTQ